jgi:hypothetical protein
MGLPFFSFSSSLVEKLGKLAWRCRVVSGILDKHAKQPCARVCVVFKCHFGTNREQGLQHNCCHIFCVGSHLNLRKFYAQTDQGSRPLVSCDG